MNELSIVVNEETNQLERTKLRRILLSSEYLLIKTLKL
jgi:hypothetical protein